jgi:PPOX class probable F420-dependent enzyme
VTRPLRYLKVIISCGGHESCRTTVRDRPVGTLFASPAVVDCVIPESHRDIFERDSFAHLATVMPDGTPQVTPVWVDHEDGEYVLVNTARGRRKEKNIRRNPKVGVSVLDPNDPYRYVSVRGRAELTEEGAVEHIHELARRYMDVDEYPNLDEESGARVIVRISTDEVATGG